MDLPEKADFQRLAPLVEMERRIRFTTGVNRSMLPGILLMCVIGYYLSPAMGQVQAIIWSVLISAVLISRRIVLNWARKQASGILANREISQWMAISGVCMGLLGMVALVYSFPALTVDQRSFVSMLYLGWLSSSMIGQSCYPKWTVYWATPLWVGLCASWALVGGFQGWAVAGLSIVAATILAMEQKTSATAITDSIHGKLRNEELLEELRSQQVLILSSARAKTSFLIAASHDLRQPAMGIGLLASALQAAPDISAAKKIAKGIERTVGTMEKILQSILEFSKLDTGQVQVQNKPLALGQMMRALLEDTRHTAHNGVELILETPEVTIVSDPDLLEQICRNLLGNAARLTTKGSIKFSASVNNNMLTLSVIDTGPGIPQDAQISIFQEYFQLGNRNISRGTGLGLGLSIAKKAALLLGAKISLTSTVGLGSHFKLTMPVEGWQLPPTGAEAVLSDDADGSNRLSGLTVLVVDDEEIVRESLQIALETFGAQVIAIDSPQACIDSLKRVEGKVAAAFVDFHIADECTGIELIQSIRAHWPGTKCVLVTGDVREEIARQAVAASIPILYKPLRIQKLIEVLAQGK